MNKQIKDKWVEALRSGKYRRGREKLYDGKGYCCLGVLCKEMDIKFDRAATFLPNKATNLSGLSKSRQVKLAEVNDGESNDIGVEGFREDIGASFRNIADWIEKNL